MSNFALTCCSTADLSEEHFKRRNISYVCFHFVMDGEVYPDDLGKTMPFDEFYTRIKNGAMPTTSQVNTDQFNEFFEPFLKDGLDICHVSLSSGLSGAYGSACIARDELSKKYPDRKIFIVDSLAASSGYGLLMDAAADQRDAGGGAEDVYNWLEANKLALHHWFFSSDLSHFKRGGRISATSAIVGTILGICPLMNVDFEGHLIQRKKIRGKKGVIEETVNTMALHAADGLNYSGKCYISNSVCLEDARATAKLIESKFKKLNGKVEIYTIGSVIGSHTGPGTVALFFFGDKRVD